MLSCQDSSKKKEKERKKNVVESNELVCAGRCVGRIREYARKVRNLESWSSQKLLLPPWPQAWGEGWGSSVLEVQEELGSRRTTPHESFHHSMTEHK